MNYHEMKKQVYFIYILLYTSCSTSAFFKGEVSLDDYGNKIESKDLHNNRKRKVNAVLFFADTTADGDYRNSSGLDYLKLEKKPDIKHCTDYPKSVLARHKRHWRFKRHTCTCYHRLQEGIMSLLNYAQRALGMVTALGSLSNHSFSNSIRFGNAEINVYDRIESNGELMQEQTKDKDVNSAPKSQISEATKEDKSAQETIPCLSEKEEERYRKIPLLNVFPKDTPPPFYAFTDEEERKRRSEGPFVTDPEHTEVFKIRTKRYTPVDKPKEISDATYLNREPKVRTIFDVMDIMNNFQRSLFGDMLRDDSDVFSHDQDACPFQHAMLGKIRQPGLFEVVQKTLLSVINASETGFLMIIIGGNLSDISSPYSPLVQSIKHVTENTEVDSTLIVLTGTCPNSPDAVVKLPCEELNKKNLPLFAIGPGSEAFRRCYELYDVPLTVKRILTRCNLESREAPPQDLEIPLRLRSKRSLIDLEEEGEEEEGGDEDYEEEEYFHVNPRRAAHGTGNAANKDKNNSKSFAIIEEFHQIGSIFLYIQSLYTISRLL